MSLFIIALFISFNITIDDMLLTRCHYVCVVSILAVGVWHTRLSHVTVCVITGMVFSIPISKVVWKALGFVGEILLAMPFIQCLFCVLTSGSKVGSMRTC